MEDTSSVESPASSLRDEGLLALMRALPLDILGKVVLTFLSISDEARLWAEESAFRTVYTWCMATHRESGLRSRKEGVWPLIRSTVAVFSQDGFVWTGKERAFRYWWEWSRQKSPGGAVRNEWDMVKHGEIVLEHLCETGAVACDEATLLAAACAGFVSSVRYLVDTRGVDPAANDNNPLCYAAKNGETDVVQLLLDLPLERGVDPGASDNFALGMAAQNGHADVVRLLLELPLERGVDPAAIDNYAFRYAAKNGHMDVVQLLLDLPLERGVDPAADNNSVFRYTAVTGQTEVVNLLLALPVGRRLSRAVIEGLISHMHLSPAMVSILIEAKAS